MHFRPCIDIHNGKVKQIVGGSLKDQGDFARDNFVSDLDGGYYASLYKKLGLKGGHIILLNPAGSRYYEEDVTQAEAALKAYPGGLMIGGGMNADNAAAFLDKGASHVIVTSYVFKDGWINYENLERMIRTVGKDHLVLDLSCRKREDGTFAVVTDRWQRFTRWTVTEENLSELSRHCDEFLIHAADVEGKRGGIQDELVEILGSFCRHYNFPVTYAGGIRGAQDLARIADLSGGSLDVTVGSALKIFGGDLDLYELAAAAESF